MHSCCEQNDKFTTLKEFYEYKFVYSEGKGDNGHGRIKKYVRIMVFVCPKRHSDGNDVSVCECPIQWCDTHIYL